MFFASLIYLLTIYTTRTSNSSNHNGGNSFLQYVFSLSLFHGFNAAAFESAAAATYLLRWKPRGKESLFSHPLEKNGLTKKLIFMLHTNTWSMSDEKRSSESEMANLMHMQSTYSGSVLTDWLHVLAYQRKATTTTFRVLVHRALIWQGEFFWYVMSLLRFLAPSLFSLCKPFTAFSHALCSVNCYLFPFNQRVSWLSIPCNVYHHLCTIS